MSGLFLEGGTMLVLACGDDVGQRWRTAKPGAALLAFMTLLVVASAALAGPGWRVATVTAGPAALAVATASLLSPSSASALHPAWAVAAFAWGIVVLALTWDESKRSRTRTR